MNIISIFCSSPDIKKSSSWSSDSQELESFSQGSNYSDTSPSHKKDLYMFEISNKSKKLSFLQQVLTEINIKLPCDTLKPLDDRVRMIIFGELSFNL